MEIREITAHRREAVGKGAARRLRRRGLVPAILYGAGQDPLPLALSPQEVHRLVGTGGRALVHVKLDGESRAALVRDLQVDPVRESLLHVDLQAIRMDEEITVEVPIHVVGEAAGVREQGGILSVLLRTVEVACLPGLIPDRLDVDVSHLRIHDTVTVADLRLPEGVRVTLPPGQALVTVSPPTAEAAAAPAAAPAAEPEVLAERKAEEGEEDRGKEAKGKK